MGWLDQLTDMLGGRQSLERFAREQANFDGPQSPDFEHWNHLVGVAPPENMQAAMMHAAQRVESQESHEHITPGVHGTNPIEGIRSRSRPGGSGIASF